MYSRSRVLVARKNDQELKLVSKAGMQKLLGKETQLSLAQCFALSIQLMLVTSLVKSISEELVVIIKTLATGIAKLLFTFADTFQEPKRIPPHRELDCHIVINGRA